MARSVHVNAKIKSVNHLGEGVTQRSPRSLGSGIAQETRSLDAAKNNHSSLEAQGLVMLVMVCIDRHTLTHYSTE